MGLLKLDSQEFKDAFMEVLVSKGLDSDNAAYAYKDFIDCQDDAEHRHSDPVHYAEERAEMWISK